LSNVSKTISLLFQ